MASPQGLHQEPVEGVAQGRGQQHGQQQRLRIWLLGEQHWELKAVVPVYHVALQHQALHHIHATALDCS